MIPFRKTKIICTLGPATNTEQGIRALIQNGMNCARLNMSHGTHEDHEKVFHLVKEIAKEEKTHVAVLIDLQGPKIRVGNLAEPLDLSTNERVILGNPEKLFPEGTSIIPVSEDFPLSDIREGHRVLINDGIIGLTVAENCGCYLDTICFSPGTVSSKKGVNLPDSNVSVGSITEKDRLDIEFAVRVQADYIALSFVSDEKDLISLNGILSTYNSSIPVIAKIERPQAIDNIESILDNCYGIMIARGDLGVEINRAKVPILQKKLLKLAKSKRKLTIVATQMIESMIVNPVPTRAEVSDVANAVLDLTDATMLSAETAAGKFPARAVRIMHEILLNVEEEADYLEDATTHLNQSDSRMADIVCHAAFQAGFDMGFPLMVAYTMSGSTAELISKHRPASRIIGITGSQKIADKMALFFGVTPVILENLETTDEPLEPLTKRIIEIIPGIEMKGKAIVITGLPLGVSGCTNTIRIINLDINPC